MDNQAYLDDHRLSFDAVGVFTCILADPDWTIEKLIATKSDNESTIRSAIAELVKYGYLDEEFDVK